MPASLTGAMPLGSSQDGGRRRGVSVKTLKKMLKKAGLKTSGKKAALTRRAKKAHLKMRGGENGDGEDVLMCDPPKVPSADGKTCVDPPTPQGGRHRRRSTRSRRH